MRISMEISKHKYLWKAYRYSSSHCVWWLEDCLQYMEPKVHWLWPVYIIYNFRTDVTFVLANSNSSPRSVRHERTCPPYKLTLADAPRGFLSTTWRIPFLSLVTSTAGPDWFMVTNAARTSQKQIHRSRSLCLCLCFLEVNKRLNYNNQWSSYTCCDKPNFHVMWNINPSYQFNYLYLSWPLNLPTR